MALTFYAASGSQFAWRVWLALEHKGCAYTLRMLSFQEGDHRQPSFLAINPRHKVPALDDDGFALYESSAIVEYLDERFPGGPALFPGDLRARALQRRIVAEVDHYLQPLHGRIARQVFFTPPPNRDADELAAALDAWAYELARYEPLLTGDTLGPSLGAADFTLYPFVATAERFDLRHPRLDAQSRLGPNLRAWRDRMRALPYHDACWPPHWRG